MTTPFADPILLPVSSVDNTSTNGFMNATIYFDASLVALGNILSVEVNLTSALNPLIPIVTYYLSYETQSQVGIANQMNISVPSSDNDYDPEIPQVMRARVIAGSKSTNEFLYTPWSNLLPVHPSPAQPRILHAYLVGSYVDPGYYYTDQIYLQLQDIPSYVETKIQIVASYYFKDKNGNNVWGITEPLSFTRQTIGSQTVMVTDPFSLSTDVSPGTSVFVGVNGSFQYGITPYFPTNTENFYAISEISLTVETTTADPESPVLNPIDPAIDYAVYTTGAQEVRINWEPPGSAFIPGYDVVGYKIYINGTEIDSVPNTVTEYIANVSSYPCATTLTFTVGAEFLSGLVLVSNAESVNVFKFATAPQYPIVSWATPGDVSGNVDILFTFFNPSDNGCGTPVDFTVEVFNSSGGTPVYSQSVPYVAAPASYYVYLNNVPSTNTGSVTVYLNTDDTNSSDVLAGASSSASYIVTTIPIISQVTIQGAELSFEVLSDVPLSLVGSFIIYDTTQQTALAFNTISTDPNYTVSYEIDDNEDYVYTFVFGAPFFGGSIPSLTNLAITVANSSGIGSYPSP